MPPTSHNRRVTVPVELLQSMQMEDVLDHVNVPSYVIDRTGVIRWLNTAARNIVGDVLGRQFTSVVAPEETRRAKELFARHDRRRRGRHVRPRLTDPRNSGH